jgi:hypothetical protein
MFLYKKNAMKKKEISIQQKNRTVSLIALLVLIGCNVIKAQLSYTFTTAGATGNIGPTQSQVDTAYALTNLNGSVTSVSGIQTWTVPFTGQYFIEARGAQGGGLAPIKFGGKGTSMKGKFFLNAGTVLKIVVGQQGSSISNCYGGGGGSFVSTLSNTPLIIAGGGGGAGGLGGGNGIDASVGTSGTSGVAGGTGGSNGNGGTAINTNAGSGAGFFTDGTGNFYMPECSTSVGKAFMNGNQGGQFDDWEPGGFGGGGSGWSGNGNGGGGGGYSGGGTSGTSFVGGGGGGSYNNGTDQVNAQGANIGDGSVLISYHFQTDILQTSSVSCFGYSTAVLSSTVIGGTPPYAYNWTPVANTNSIISGIGAGTYTLTVIDANNVIAKAVYTVAQPNGFTISTSASNATICKGDSMILTANGATTYTWSNTIISGQWFKPTASNTFTVNGTLNGCNSSATISVVVNNLPQLSVSGPSLMCNGTSETLIANGATTYTWLNGSNSQSITASPSTNTTFVVSGTANQGCVATYSFDVTVSNCTGLDASLNKIVASPLKLYPNPNNGIFTIELGEERGVLIVTDMIGTIVLHITIEQTDKIDLSQLSNGLYSIKVITNNSTCHHTSFIKQ